MKVYVGNLSKEVTDAQLNELAVPYGSAWANVARELAGGTSKGFGFLQFANAEEGRAAIAALNGRDFNGQALKVNESRPRRERTSAASARY